MQLQADALEHMPRLGTGAKVELAARDTCGTHHVLTLGTWEKKGKLHTTVLYNLTGHLPCLRTYGLDEGDYVVFR